jgi:RHS repeat-associated protein
MKKEGMKIEAHEVSEIIPATEHGHSIAELIEIASRYGYKLKGLRLSLSQLSQIPLPAIVQVKSKRGHYWVIEEASGESLRLYDPQSQRRFSQTPKEFSKQWSGIVLISASKAERRTPGEVLSTRQMREYQGGCCGVPRPESDLGDPAPEEGCPKGSPVWRINKINMNFYLTDIPLWYDPPIGPPVRIQLSYNSQSSIAYYEPFGNKWMFNYGSYLVEDPSGDVTVFMPDGRRDVYSPDGQGGYTRPFGVFNTLRKIADNHYELEFPDGTVYVYNIPEGTNSLQPLLVEIRDAYGQKLTFGYNTDVQLTTITDALGRVTSITYNTDSLITQVTDPFGRTALFEYDANRNLIKITDMGGYWTELSYDQDVYITRIEDASGRWDIYTEPSDGDPAGADLYPPPGGPLWESYRITITNPLGKKEEYFYYGGCDEYTCDGYTWYVSPRDYIPYIDENTNNFNSNVPKTRYFLTQVSGKGKIYQVLYPEGGSIYYDYDLNGNITSISDDHPYTIQYTYNDMGRITSITDAKNITTTINYYPNNVDILSIVNELGTISLTYNDAHDITSITDRLSNTTTYTYNTYGQLTSIVEAQGSPLERKTEFLYDSTTYELTELKRAGNTILTFTHDQIGRIKTITDARGVTLTYDYDNLDRVTKITYPDQKSITISYASCCPNLIESITDRSGRTTSYEYDALGRLIKATDPAGRITRYNYDANGNLIELIDPNNNVTTFEYDKSNRLIKKTYPDGKFITYEYDYADLLTRVMTSRNIEKLYSYDENHNLIDITYSDITSPVSFTYDNYNRLIEIADWTNIYQYTYDANNRLTQIDGPWANDTITFEYNELGQLTAIISEGGQRINYNYDALGRLKTIQVGTDTFTYTYTGANPLIQSLTRPNGSVTEYIYNDPLKRLTEINNKDSSQQIINKHAFTYNNLDLIGTETITTGLSLPSFQEGLTTYNYNNLNQLLSSTNPDRLFTYDADGNMTKGYTPEGYQFTAYYDAENRLKTIQYTDSNNVVHKTKYLYSGDGLLARIKKYENGSLVSDVRIVRAGFLPIQERDANNNVIREYIWGIDKGGGIEGLLSMIQNGQRYYYLYDGKGNVNAVIDGNQQVVASYRYDPFGVLLAKAGTLDQPFRFSTKRYDEATGLYYYGYRFYNPIIGRWLTRDPLGELGGINLYGFVGNNPVNFYDPLGLYSFRQFLQETATYSGVAAIASALTPGGQMAFFVFSGISAGATGLEIVLYSEHPYIDTLRESIKMMLPVKKPYDMFTGQAIDITADKLKEVIDRNQRACDKNE